MLPSDRFRLAVRGLARQRFVTDAVGTNSRAVNPRTAPHEIAQIVPIEFRAMLKFLHQPRGIESIPPCQSLSTTSLRMIGWSSGLVAASCGKNSGLEDSLHKNQ